MGTITIEPTRNTEAKISQDCHTFTNNIRTINKINNLRNN